MDRGARVCPPRRRLLVSACLLGAIVALALSSPARGIDTPAASLPPPGTAIDSGNLAKFAALVPAAMAFAIEHGLTVHVVPTRRIQWPRKYQEATEHYSPQVRLDAQGAMQNYLAGLPFPSINPADPQAALKVAYNWHWGPFIPSQITLLATQKTRAWVVNPSSSGLLTEDDAHRDFRNEGSCEQIVIVRYMHTLQELDNPRHRDTPIEFKQRGDYCGPEPSAYIMIQYLDPARSSDAWFFPTAIRRWRRMKWKGGYPHQSCTYACSQFWWEYVPPKTEAYTYKLLGERPVLTCLDAKEQRAAIVRRQDTARFGNLDCEIRPAYVLSMTPQPAPENILPAEVLLDKETYLVLGARFYRDTTPDTLVPIWSRQTSRTDDTQMVLADDFYVPSDRPLYFLSMNMDEETNMLDSDTPSNNLFNPKAQGYEPH
jgi:hypothetical protein